MDSLDFNLTSYQVLQPRIGLTSYYLLLCSSLENDAANAVPISSNFCQRQIYSMFQLFLINAQRHFSWCLTRVFVMFCSSATTPPKLHHIFESAVSVEFVIFELNFGWCACHLGAPCSTEITVHIAVGFLQDLT